MGCFSSKEATPEEKQQICKQMSKEMMNVCLLPAIANADKIVIKMPPDFSKMTDARDKLRKLAADATDGKPGGAEDAGNAAAAGGGGGLMGMVNKGLAAAEKAVEAVGDAIGSGFAMGFSSMADVLDNAMAGIEKPMSTIGKDLIAAKKDEITKVMSSHIVNSQVDDAFSLVAGSNNAISEYIVGKASSNLAKQLMVAVDDYVKEHDTIKMWNAAVGKYNEAIEKARQAGVADKLNLQGIQLDIKEYICEQAVLGLCQQMGEQEGKIRAAPQNQKVRSPAVFFKVFNKDILLQKDYKQVIGA